MPNFEIWLGNFFFPFSCCLLLRALWQNWKAKKIYSFLKDFDEIPVYYLCYRGNSSCETIISISLSKLWSLIVLWCKIQPKTELTLFSQCRALMCITFHVIFLMPERRKQLKFSFVFLHPTMLGLNKKVIPFSSEESNVAPYFESCLWRVKETPIETDLKPL